MNALALFWPNDQILIWAVNVLLQVTIVTGLALAIAALTRTNAAMRYWAMCCSLLVALLCPAIAVVTQWSETNLISIALAERGSPSANGAEREDQSEYAEATRRFSLPLTDAEMAHASSRLPLGAAARSPAGSRNGNQHRTADHGAEGDGAALQLFEASVPGNRASMLRSTLYQPTWLGRVLRVVMPPVVLVWLGGAGLLLARFGIGCCRLVALLRTAAPITNAPVAEALQQVCRALHVKHAPRLFVSGRVSGPISTGLLRPCVVLPESLTDHVPAQQLHDILMHEVAHIVRHDQVVAVLQSVTAAIFWPHPLVKGLNRRLAQAREEVCDNVVLASSDGPSYCRTLLALAQWVQSTRPLPGAVGLFTSRWKLERRIADLLDERRNRATRLTMRGRALVTGLTLGLLAVVSCGTVSLAVGQTPATESAAEDAETVSSSTDSTPSTNGADSEARVVTGSVVGPDGQPAAGAFVAAVGWRLTGDEPYRGDTVAKGLTDAKGRYQLVLGDVSSKTHSNANLIARAEDSAIAWKRIDLNAAQSRIDLALQRQQPIRIRLVGIEGRPATNLAVDLAAIVPAEGKGDLGEGIGLRYLDPRPPAAGPTLVTDQHGLLTVPHIPADHGVYLKVFGDERFAPQDLALNTGQPEERGERDATYRPLFKNMAPGEVATLPLAPAQTFEGVVLFGDTGQPAANARITMWASQQEFGGSMISIDGRTDDEGRFRLNPYPGIRFGIIAYPPEGTPYLVRRINDLRWTSGEASKDLEVRLDRAVLAHGTVIDATSGRPIPGAAVQYHPDRLNPNVTSDVVTGWQGIQNTDEMGRFEITVLPGPGMLLVHAPEGSYILQTIGSRELTEGQTGGVRMYAHAFRRINPQPDQPPEPLQVELAPGGSVSGTLTDPDGEPIEHAVVVSRLKISPHSPRWRGFPDAAMGGRFRIDGLREGEEYPVYFLDAKNRLGASAIISTDRPSPTIVLEPCGSATARFVDPEGKPVAAGIALGLQMVVTPGKPKYDRQAMDRGELLADEDFVSNIDRVNYRPTRTTDKNGRIAYPVLIPGARYRFIAFDDGIARVAKEFVAASGENYDMGEIEIEVND